MLLLLILEVIDLHHVPDLQHQSSLHGKTSDMSLHPPHKLVKNFPARIRIVGCMELFRFWQNF